MSDFLNWVAAIGFDLAVRATVLFVMAWGMSLALAKGSAAQRHLVWGAALAGSLLLPVIYFGAPQWRVWPTPASKQVAASAMPETAMTVGGNDSSTLGAVPSESLPAALPASPVDSPTTAQDFSFQLASSLARIVAALWLAGVLGGCLRLVLGFARLQKIARYAEPATGRMASLLEELARATGIRRSVLGLVSREPISPLTWGWLRPVVMLPVEAEAWSVERLRVVLLHELAHVRRGDFVTQFVGELARCLYWFHPLAWWSVRCLRVEQEAACDDCVLAAGATADDYAEELLAVMARLPYGFRGAGVALAMSRAKRIEARVRSILASDCNRSPVGTWRLTWVASLFLMLATVTAIIGPQSIAGNKSPDSPTTPNESVTAKEPDDTSASKGPAPDTSKDGAKTLSADLVKRLQAIGAGSQQPTREDVSLVLRALQDSDSAICSQACLAVEKMAFAKRFLSEDLKALWAGLRPQLRSHHDDASEWSSRAVSVLARDSGLLSNAFLPDRPWTLGREPLDTERLAGEVLYGACDESLLMLSSDDRELQRRGANLSSSLVMLLAQERQEKLVRALLAIPSAPGADLDSTSAEVRCRGQVASALVQAAPGIKTESLANDVAVRLLEAARQRAMVERGVFRGLAYLAATTRGETRQQIVNVVIAATADAQLIYSRTSGIYTPPKHYGADALAILAPLLTAEELERAERAIPLQAAGEPKEEYDSQYAAAQQALIARKLEVEQQRQPAEREEEDLAFFEKKYKTKINDVKPKGEYADPDQFYSAIGKQLGIPEIAWQAAAEKFGWRKDDGIQTFTMLKGGPTSEGGQGTWDVLFLRSKINPETKKPDPATVEQVMVQIDYDGNVSFPEIPRRNQ